MKITIIQYAFFASFLLAAWGAQAQQSLNASGGEAQGATGTVSYTLGQIDHIAVESPKGRMNHGVQQPFELLRKVLNARLPCLIYPNPTPGPLQISVPHPGFLSFSYRIYDVRGVMVGFGDNVGASETIQIDEFTPGAYFVNIVNNKGEGWNCIVVKL